jgi:hypothetical protein
MTIKLKAGTLATFAVGASLLFAAGDASAAWVAIEGFNYTVGGAPGSTGFGWATGAWTANGAVVTSPGLTYPGLGFSGNALGGTPGSAATRQLNTPILGTSGFILMRILIDMNSPGTQVSQATFGNNNGFTDGHFIIGDLPQLDAEAANWGIQNGNSRCYSSTPAPVGTTLLVARIDFDSGSFNDRQRLWINPAAPVNPSALLSVPPDIDVTNYNITQVAGVFWQTQANIAELDEIAFFTGAVADFTNIVPTGTCY